MKHLPDGVGWEVRFRYERVDRDLFTATCEICPRELVMDGLMGVGEGGGRALNGDTWKVL
jgi:hypothetical protein